MDASLKIQNKDEQPAQDVNTAFKSVALGAPSSNIPQFPSPVLKICPIMRFHCPGVVRNNLKITFLFSKKDLQYNPKVQPQLTGYHNVIVVANTYALFQMDVTWPVPLEGSGVMPNITTVSEPLDIGSKGLSDGERHGFQRF